MDGPNAHATNPTEESAASPGAQSSNPFRNALNKFAPKKKERANLNTSATSGFFSRPPRGLPVKNPALPGSVKQVCAGQMPPVWAAPVPASQRAKEHEGDNRESNLSRSLLESTGSGIDNRDEENLTSRSLDWLDSPAKSLNGVELSDQQPAVGSARSTRKHVPNFRSEQFRRLLQSDVVDLEKLRQLSWSGIPVEYRPTAWRLLLGYMPSKQDRRQAMLQRKRQEYMDLLHQYYYIPDTDRGPKEQGTLRQILVDIPRTNADVKLFQNERIHQCMERVLYTWAIRHPASGYVQGINDLLTPFLVVFLTEYVDNPQTCDLSLLRDEELDLIEADSYWCLTKLLDGIQDHYTFAQPGLQRMVQRMQELVHRLNLELYQHIVDQEGVQFVQFAFRWMNCLLMREMPLNAIIRLWDTYLCEENGFEGFHVYVCAAILMLFADQLMVMEFQDLVLFLQNLPTKDWAEQEIDPLLSRAFILQTYFADAPSHLTQ